MPRDDHDLPSLDALGRDLLIVSKMRLIATLAAPFLLVISFFVLAVRGWWLAALLCTMLLTFLTYGSISHDLVHRNLRLPRWLNEVLLCAIELMTFRCGHAYRIVHLHHHAHFPSTDDIEGSASAMSWWRALLEGVILQQRLLLFAARSGRDRAWIMGEASAVMILFAGCVVAIPITPIPAIYAALMIAGSWIFPFMTAYVPHLPRGATEIHQTRLFRGKVLDLLALRHLYHLEHHLYPQIPHHNWPEAARRLDPYFARAGLTRITLLF